MLMNDDMINTILKMNKTLVNKKSNGKSMNTQEQKSFIFMTVAVVLMLLSFII